MSDLGGPHHHDVGPRQDEIGCCGPAVIGAFIVFALLICGVAFLVWTLLAWIGGVR